jgi:hypothetical protein
MRVLTLLFISLVFAPAIKAQNKAEEDVKQVLSSYKQKLEKLDTSGVTSLFVSGAKVYEAGKDEGASKITWIITWAPN